MSLINMNQYWQLAHVLLCTIRKTTGASCHTTLAVLFSGGFKIIVQNFLKSTLQNIMTLDLLAIDMLLLLGGCMLIGISQILHINGDHEKICIALHRSLNKSNNITGFHDGLCRKRTSTRTRRETEAVICDVGCRQQHWHALGEHVSWY